MQGSGTSLIRFERENANRPLTRGAAERFAFGLSPEGGGGGGRALTFGKGRGVWPQNLKPYP